MNTPPYQHQGAQALVALHATHLRDFLKVWRRAQSAQLQLPNTKDPNYANLESLLAHVLGCATGYLQWICKNLELPAPELERNPPVENFSNKADVYLEAVLAAWKKPLTSLTEEQAESPAFPSAWGPPYIIDAMLEHAVMHPIRHSHQLKKLLGENA